MGGNPSETRPNDPLPPGVRASSRLLSTSSRHEFRRRSPATPRSLRPSRHDAPTGCGLGWTTLAAIGWVESQHGTLGGRTLSRDGHSFSAIIGPSLDGSGDVAAITADPSPHDLDDAAAAAAAYLCADGRSLTGTRWAQAVLSYNHDAGYVGLVHAAAETYAERTS